MARERYRIGDLLLDVDAVTLRRDEKASLVDLALPKLSFDLLVSLVRRAPAVVTNDELIALVWEGAAVSDETLTQRVALLRRALGDDAKQPRYLRSVRGRGYQIVPEVTAIPDPGAAPTEAPDLDGTPALPGTEPLSRPRSRILVGSALIAAIALVALLILAVLFARNPRRPAPIPEHGANAPVATEAPTVPELLERAGSYLRQQQERDNMLAQELYRRALALEPRDPSALAGLSLALGQRATKFNQRGEEIGEALDLARRAIAIDPRLGIAHHALGLALDAQGRIDTALAAYRRAAELEPDPGPALASAAHLLQISGHLAAALEMDLQAAGGRKNGDASPYLEVQIGATLSLLGLDAPATVWFERALELRPDNVFAAIGYARHHLSRSRLREADELAASALARGVRRPELWEIRGTIALLRGDDAGARRSYDSALVTAPGFLRAATRLILLDLRQSPLTPSVQRRRDDLLAGIREGRKLGDEWPDSWIDEALIETSGADRPAALEALDRAIARGYRDTAWLMLEPGFAPLRDDPQLGPSFLRRVEAVRAQVDAERQRVLGAPWLPPSFLTAAPGRAAKR